MHGVVESTESAEMDLDCGFCFCFCLLHTFSCSNPSLLTGSCLEGKTTGLSCSPAAASRPFSSSQPFPGSQKAPAISSLTAGMRGNASKVRNAEHPEQEPAQPQSSWQPWLPPHSGVPRPAHLPGQTDPRWLLAISFRTPFLTTVPLPNSLQPVGTGPNQRDKLPKPSALCPGSGARPWPSTSSCPAPRQSASGGG